MDIKHCTTTVSGRWAVCLLLALLAIAPAGMSADGYTLRWKRKKNKMALIYKPSKKEKKRQMTDFIFDGTYDGSFYTYKKSVRNHVQHMLACHELLPESDNYNTALMAIAVKTDKGWGVINGLGEVIVPYGTYDSADDDDFLYGLWGGDSNKQPKEFRVYKKGQGWGIIELYAAGEGKNRRLEYREKAAPQYSSIAPLLNEAYMDLAAPYKMRDWKLEYRKINYYSRDKHSLLFAAIGKDRKYGLYNRLSGEIVSPVYDVKSFWDGEYYDHNSINRNSVVKCVVTDYGVMYAMIKDGRKHLVWGGVEEPFWTSRDSVNYEDYKSRRNFSALPSFHCDKRDGIYIDGRYPISLTVNYVAKRVRVMPDELWDLYETTDSCIRALDFKIPAHVTKVSAFPDKSGWFSCVDQTGDTLAGYWTPQPRAITFLNNVGEMRQKGETVRRHGPWEIFRVDGHLGLRHDKSDFILPPIYDTIVADPSDRYMLIGTRPVEQRPTFWGLVSAEGVITPAQFDSLRVADNGQIVMSRHRWPDVYGIFNLNQRKGAHSQPFTLTFDAETGAATYNFDELLAQYNSTGSEKNALELYKDLESLGATLDLDNFRALNNEMYGLWLASDESRIDRAGDYMDQAVRFSDDNRFKESRKAVAQQKKAYASARAEEARIRAEAERMRAQEAARQSYSRQMNKAQAWAQLAGALGQLAGGINNAVSQYSATKNRRNNSSSATRSYSPQTTSSAGSSSNEYIPVKVLEVWVPGAGHSGSPTYNTLHWYKRFYGNRWCLFPTKNSRHFHVGTTNNDRKCHDANVSGFRYKAIDPKVIGGTKYYYFE